MTVLFDAIINDTPHNDTERGAYSTLTAIMGRMAAHTGQVITWDDALNSMPYWTGILPIGIRHR